MMNIKPHMIRDKYINTHQWLHSPCIEPQNLLSWYSENLLELIVNNLYIINIPWYHLRVEI